MTIRIRPTSTANIATAEKSSELSTDTVIEMESVATDDEIPLKSPQTSNSLLSLDNRRQQVLTKLHSTLTQQAANDQPDQLSILTKETFIHLFSNEEVLAMLFQLLDYHAKGKLIQAEILDSFKEKLRFDTNERHRELVNFLDTSFYVHAGDKDLDFELFMRVLRSKRIIEKIFNVINVDETSDVSVSVMNVMSFITNLTYLKRSCDLNAVNWEFADDHFRKLIEEKNGELSLEQFKKMIPCKNSFFAERAFSIFDKDKSGKVSMVEYHETLDQFCSQSVEDKVRFLFKLYDKNGDGLIKLDELKVVLEACVEENGLQFTNDQIDQLTKTLYHDAISNLDESASTDANDEGIRFEQLKSQMVKHPGLLENLSISLEQFLLPEISKANKKHASKTIPKLSFSAVRNNAVFILFVSVYFIVNASLFISRAIYYKDEFTLYMLARAAGQCLNFNCAFVVVLMLRHSITWLRMHSFSHFLPLDHHVYLHKMCGTVIVALVLLHCITHVIDFVLNIADQIVPNVSDAMFTWWEWLFTTKPGVFGLIPGWACLTGWAIFICLTIMAICSLPFVRRRGSFEVFYWTHLLYIPFWILLIIHAPHFWIWFAFPGLMFVIEKMYRFILQWTGHSETCVKSAAVFPSRVAHLVIKRPPNFKYCPGDYVFVKVKKITSIEWHPFTLSSAPESPDVLWLHVICAGGWTNKLYDHVKQQVEIEKQKLLGSMNTVDEEISQESNGDTVDLKGNNQKREIPTVSKSLDDLEMKSVLFETEPTVQLTHPIEISLDGPYGTPSSRIFQASHAVLIAAGIGVTPFASILQSIMYRHYANQQNTSKKYTMNLKKVDFFWINRDQRCFEWFVHLLSQLEIKQAELGGAMERFLDMHMYVTSALKNTDMKAVGLQMALDLLYAKGHRDLVTGLKTRTNAGRPNWDKVFEQIFDQNKGKVTVFYCGPPQLAKELKMKCNEFGFNFRKECF